MTSPISGPPSPATSLWTSNWILWSGRHQLQWHVWQRESGTTPCWPPTPRYGYTRSPSLAHSSMAARPEPCTPTMNADFTCSTCTILGGFWASAGESMSQKRASWPRQKYQACFPAEPKPSAFAWPHQLHARWLTSQRHYIQWACPRFQTTWKAFPSLQRHLKTQSKCMQRQSRKLGNHYCRPQYLEAYY